MDTTKPDKGGWVKKTLKPPDIIALGLCLSAIILWTKILVDKYLRFGYYDWDLAFFSQATWNLLHGSQYSSLFGLNFFSNHANFIAYLILPVYALSPHPMTLVFLKVLSCVGGAFILYKIAKETLGWTPAVLLMFLYLIYPANIFTVIYEFDFETLSPVFLFLMFYFFKKERFIPFLITALLTIIIKENMPLIVAAFGVYALFSRKKNKLLWGVLPLALGLISFYVLITLVIPSFSSDGNYIYLGQYQSFGHSPFEIIKAVLSHPLQTLKVLFEPAKLRLLRELFSPLFFLPLLSPHVTALSFPIIFQHLLSPAHQGHSIYYQYTSSITPFIFLAAATFLAIARHRLRPFTFYALIGLMFIFNILNTLSYAKPIVERLYPHIDRLDTARWQMVRMIPKDASVIATFDFLAELSTRKSLYAFHKIYSDNYRQFILPDEVTYALIDPDDPWLQQELCADYTKVNNRIREFLLSSDWIIKASAGKIMLLKRDAKPNQKEGSL
ncbi:MAG TPA: DUF2079 domain-containing protein [Candidatus Omnitrophota bacterium]|nr:DUF2079 domain-containing protein [Candidatus Omnitrophota bacterium]HPD85251.1 DUF2079 domain-containing protein [Candidatus Omnitrophota bacterium]HRZ04248.1 DUF2079 domain-containing protein [Candidatus Omnitrophota bacterium]